MVLYQLLTGKLPVGAWEAPSQSNPEVDATIDKVVTRAVQYDREKRYQDVGEMSRDLREAWQRIQGANPSGSQSRRRWIMGVAAAVSGAAIVAAKIASDSPAQHRVQPRPRKFVRPIIPGRLIVIPTAWRRAY